MVAAGAGSEIVPFSNWRQRALSYAAANPRSSLARIATVLDGCDEKSVADMSATLPLVQHVFGGSDHVAPLVDDELVGKYLDRMHALQQAQV